MGLGLRVQGSDRDRAGPPELAPDEQSVAEGRQGADLERGLAFGVWSPGLRVCGLKFMVSIVYGLWSMVYGLSFMVNDLWFMVQGWGRMVHGVGLRS